MRIKGKREGKRERKTKGEREGKRSREENGKLRTHVSFWQFFKSGRLCVTRAVLPVMAVLVAADRISVADELLDIASAPHPLLWQPFLSAAEAVRCVCTENSSIGFGWQQHPQYDRVQATGLHYIHCVPKKRPPFIFPITLSKVNRF